MRSFIGNLLILHGLAHAGAGMWAAGPTWLTTILWWFATGLYISAGFGVLGVSRYTRWAPELCFAALIPSSLLLGQFAGWFVLPGIALDVILVILVLRLRNSDALSERSARARGRAAHVLTVGFLIYTSGAILLRPFAMRWGTTAQDRQTTLFGDSLDLGARYVVDNAITIRAPADSVWPWIAQIGQDRDAGRIEAIEQGRAIVLENWGAFIVQPIDSNRCRLYIRQRNRGTPSFVGNLVAPLGLLVMEPAHFIMQQAMLRGVKRRAES